MLRTAVKTLHNIPFLHQYLKDAAVENLSLAAVVRPDMNPFGWDSPPIVVNLKRAIDVQGLDNAGRALVGRVITRWR